VQAIQTQAREHLFESWSRNARVNESLLDHLTPDLMTLRPPEGGWTVAQHLVHLIGFRKGWLSYVSPRHQEDLSFLFSGDEEGEFEPTTLDSAVMKEAFRAGDAAVLAAVQEAVAAGGSFGVKVYVDDPRAFMQHALVHDAHHRAQILMTLRLAGHPWREADGPMWAPWRE